MDSDKKVLSLSDALLLGLRPSWAWRMTRDGGTAFCHSSGQYNEIVHIAIKDSQVQKIWDQWLGVEPPTVGMGIFSQGKLGLVKVWRPIMNPGQMFPKGSTQFDLLGGVYWELPRGFADPGENHDQAAWREVEEELGVKPDYMEKLGYYNPNTSSMVNSIPIYQGKITSVFEAQTNDSEEISGVGFFTKEGVQNYIRNQKMPDGFLHSFLTHLWARGDSNWCEL